jgi:hypothetical protein
LRELNPLLETSARIDKHKLEAIYKFIRAMPEVFEPTPAVGGKRKRGAFDGKMGRHSNCVIS